VSPQEVLAFVQRGELQIGIISQNTSVDEHRWRAKQGCASEKSPVLRDHKSRQASRITMV